MAFQLKEYKPLSSDIVTLWYDILDIIGPVRNWPPSIRNLFFKNNLTHTEILKLATFGFVNGLNPDMLVDWCDKMNLHSNKKSRHDMIHLLVVFETDPDRYKHMYQYNVLWHRYEFLDGTIKYYLPKDKLHPW